MFTVGNQYPVQKLTEEVFRTLAPKGLILMITGTSNLIFYYKGKFSFVDAEGFNIDKVIADINTNRHIPRIQVMGGAWDCFLNPRRKFLIKQLKRPQLQKARHVNT